MEVPAAELDLVDRPTAFRPSSLRRVVSLSWYEERALSQALCPPCKYLCGLCLLLSLPSTFICFAQLWPTLAAFDGPVLVDGAIRWLPLGLELGFNGTRLSLRPEGAAYRAQAEAEAEAEATGAEGSDEAAEEGAENASPFVCWEDGGDGDGDWCAHAEIRPATLRTHAPNPTHPCTQPHAPMHLTLCTHTPNPIPYALRCADAEMVPLRLRFSQLLYDALYLDLPPPFSVPPVPLLVAAAAAVGVASANELLSEEPFA